MESVRVAIRKHQHCIAFGLLGADLVLYVANCSNMLRNCVGMISGLIDLRIFDTTGSYLPSLLA